VDTDKRTFNFILFALMIFSLWMLIDSQINPRNKPKPKPNLAADSKAEEEKRAETEENANQEKAAQEGDEAPRPVVARQHVTLGSLKDSTGYTMLVTFDNLGAGVERIELAGDKYHDMERRGGYIGYLALADDEKGGGPIVQTVGDGTPASLATAAGVTGGIAKDDRLKSIDGEAIDTSSDLSKYLDKKTKPKQVVQIEVERGTGASATKHTFSVTLGRTPLALVQREDNSIFNSFVDATQPAEPLGPVSFRLGLRQVDEAAAKTGDMELKGLPSLYESPWNYTVIEDGAAVEFSLDLSEAELKKVGATGPLRITKRYRLPNSKDGKTGPKQHLTLEVEIENLSEKETDVAYRLEGPNGLPTEGWWYYVKLHPDWFAGAGARDVAYNLAGRHYLAGLPSIISDADKKLADKAPPVKVLLSPNDGKRLHYIASDTQYFAVAMVPEARLELNAANNPEFTSVAAEAFPLNRAREKSRNKLTNTSFRITSPVEKVPPGAKFTDKYVIFAGPKDHALLDQYGLGYLVEYGWFGVVSRFLSQVLALLRWMTGSYGLAIIGLTLIVRGAMLPISLRQAKSMAKMEALKPEMEKIKEKHKGDAVKQQQ
jgi:YidC/Oxa1 family membrane protein insertase